MDDIFHDGNRELQDKFDTRRLAERVKSIIHDRISPKDKVFIESLDMFFTDSNGFCGIAIFGDIEGISEAKQRTCVSDLGLFTPKYCQN